MKVILNSGFRNPAISSLIKSYQVDQKGVIDKNKKYREFAVNYLSKEYKLMKNSVDRLNYQNKKAGLDQVKLPIFDTDLFLKTGELSSELFKLFEYGDPYRMLPPKQTMSKLRKLCK